jgi:3-deoxy-7-phosphoheptulonate synthase
MSKERLTQRVPSLVDADEPASEETNLHTFARADTERRPYLVRIAGPLVGQAHPLQGADEVTIGRLATSLVFIDEDGVSRRHARIYLAGADEYAIEDLESANGTLLNGRRIAGTVKLRDGDKIQVGAESVLKFALLDEVEERYQHLVFSSFSPQPPSAAPRSSPWFPEGWRSKTAAQSIDYDDQAALDAALTKLRRLPPLVTSWEIEDLKKLIAEAQEGRRFLLQGGDCAETLDDCESNTITNKLKILIQMSLVLIRGSARPVIRVGRFAGQYAKPRSRATEVRDGLELPSYFGDLVNGPEFTAAARRPDPTRLLDGYFHAAVTLNFIRALSSGGFSDLRRPEYFDLSYFERAELPTTLKMDYSKLCREITHGLQFLRSFGDRSAEDLMKVSFFTSHEGLNLFYEAAQTRQVPRREGFYDLTTHMPWIGERTRALDGAHVEFFRGVGNPIAVKLGPTAEGADAVRLCNVLNPTNEAGKLVIITRMGATKVVERLPRIIEAVQKAGLRVLWVCDPMHGNATVTPSGIKTRDFADILEEIERAMDVHHACGTYFGGVHFELTGEDVTECIGGGLSEADLSRNYGTLCDPRLNYRQAIQMAFCVARRLGDVARPPSTAPPPMR